MLIKKRNQTYLLIIACTLLAFFGFVVTTGLSQEYIGGQGSGIVKGITVCDKFVAASPTGIATIELIPLVSGQRIRVCSYVLQGASGASGSGLFAYGTGINCVTGLTNISPFFNFQVASISLQPASVASGSGNGELFQTPVGNALCFTTDTSLEVLQVFVTYTIY